MRTIDLFAYGLLQPGLQPPRTMSAAVEDFIRGDLYDLGEYPGAINLDTSANTIPGFVVTIEHAELPEIDAFEDVDSGEYVRRVITTLGGREVFVYEYAWTITTKAKLIPRWPPA